MLSFFTLLLFAAATTTTTTAQETKPKLAILVVGTDDWMIGDVFAHLVGEELNRGKTYTVVTRESYVQNKLEFLRRGYDRLDENLLRSWATERGISTLCFVTPTAGFNFSLRLLDVSSGEVLCSVSGMEPNAVALKQLAWSLTGSMGSSCTFFDSWRPFGSLGSYTEPLIGMEMVYVEGGRFRMGCAGVRDGGTDGVSSGYNGDCGSSEEPDHDVRVGSFLIGRYEVTQAQWEAVMGTTIAQQRNKVGSASDYPLYGVGADFPMYYVGWEEAQAFCDTLSARTGRYYRLATGAEWEYAARGGKFSRGYKYSGGNNLDSVAWHGGSAAHAVGGKLGNELGIYDMSGNVYEWCSIDLSSSYYYPARGGSWSRYAKECRVANVLYLDFDDPIFWVGFRVV
jgi:formylglycine-generating enzyme required for sulfatase activity